MRTDGIPWIFTQDALFDVALTTRFRCAVISCDCSAFQASRAAAVTPVLIRDTEHWPYLLRGNDYGLP
jgi:hypothetical protein